MFDTHRCPLRADAEVAHIRVSALRGSRGENSINQLSTFVEIFIEPLFRVGAVLKEVHLATRRPRARGCARTRGGRIGYPEDVFSAVSGFARLVEDGYIGEGLRHFRALASVS